MTHRNIIRAFALAAGVFAVAATWGCGGHSFSVGTPAGYVGMIGSQRGFAEAESWLA